MTYQYKSKKSNVSISKGIGIILMVIGHIFVCYDYKFVHNFIYAFHMPLFFWCSGYLITMKNPCGKGLQGTLKRILIKKATAILVPYVVFSLLIIAYQVLLQLLHSHTFDTTSFIEKLIRIIELKGMESLWFLPCLLLAECLFLILYTYLPPWCLGLICLACIALNFIFNNMLPSGILGTLIRSTTGFFFFFLGSLSYALSGRKIKNEKLRILSSPLICIFAIILGAIISLLNGFAAIGSYEFGFVPFFYISAFLTLQGCIGLCEIVPKSQIVPFFGKNSIVVLCTNNILIEILRLLDSKLNGNFFISHGILGNFLFAILLAIIELPIIIIGMKYFYFLFGVFPNKETTHYESEKT